MNDEVHQLLDEATASRQLPGVSVGIFDREGTIYEAAFGARSLSTNQPMERDTVFSIMSMTKPIAAVACLQAVERGLLHLDQPGREILPWLGEVEVLEGYDDEGRPQLRPARTDITLRNLLTHTSGFVYEIWNEHQARYLKATDTAGVSGGTRDDYRQPLAFDPGERWEYGIGIDWATMLLEQVTGQPLPQYLHEHVLGPLAMTDTSYVPTPAMELRRAPVHTRDEHGRFAASSANPRGQNRKFHGGGGGLYSTVADYGRFLRMLLNGGSLDGAHILDPATVALAGRNHMGDLRVTPLATTSPATSADAEFFPGLSKSWGLSFQINNADAPTGRPAGSLSWAGLLNTFFWVDPTNAVAGVFMTQTLPFVDPGVLAAFTSFESAVYASVRRPRRGSAQN